MTTHYVEPPPSARLTRSIVRMNASQYHRMLEQGIIPEDASTELLNGIIVHKDRSDSGGDPMGHGPRHRLIVRLLTRLVSRIDSSDRHLQIQLPIRLSLISEPEPDGAVILGPDRQFADDLPGAEHVASVIEVADSSLERDAEEKHRAYAGAGIPQYVIVNLRENKLEIHSAPEPASGRYTSIRRAGKGETFELHLGGGRFLEIIADDLLP